MRISRVYTRTGDQGRTSLVGGQDVGKDDPRVEAFGAVDELNSVLGLTRVFNLKSQADQAAQTEIDRILRLIQNELFNLGGCLATKPADRVPGMPAVGAADVARMEADCDRFNEDLGPLQEFILPGGGEVGAFLHQARTVCRRAERRVSALLHSEPEADAESLRYLNRLSDLLFVLARWAAKAEGIAEYLWQKPGAEQQ